MDFLKAIFGDKALTYSELEAALKDSKDIKLANLAGGTHCLEAAHNLNPAFAIESSSFCACFCCFSVSFSPVLVRNDAFISGVPSPLNSTLIL